MSIRQIRPLPIILVILLIFLQYRLWFQPGGIVDMMHLKKRLAVEAQQNEQLKKRNQVLVGQVARLQKNHDAIETRARRELGMVKKGETFYQVVK
jgi:cell division protein FtsB